MRVRLLSPATEEISAAVEWFESQRSGLGSEFWHAVDDVLCRVQENAQSFPRSEFATADMDLRFALVRRFKYIIHFAIEAEEAQIIAVAHGARRSGYWRRRIKLRRD